MDHLPDELLCSIFKYAIEDISQLLILQLVCKKFHRLSNNAYLWYYAYKNMYPHWTNAIQYAHKKQACIDWKYYMLKLYKQRHSFQQQFKLEPILSAKSKSYKIQEPFVSDIDPVTNTGIIAVSKYCRFTRHKILFYTYPSYQLLRKFELQFQIDDLFEWSCQIIGIQTIRVNKKDVRLFAVAINQPRPTTDSDDDEQDEQENDDNNQTSTPDETKTLWKVILVYQLHSDGSTTCLAHLETSSLFLGRGIWFFQRLESEKKTRDWLKIISPSTVDTYDPKFSIFMLAYGLSMTRFAGYSQTMQFNLSVPCHDLLDPTKTVYRYDEEQDRFRIANQQQQKSLLPSQPTAKIISTFYLGGRVSCMIHFRLPHALNHLIVTGNFLRDELSVYDWRFGVKVGIFYHPNTTHSVQPWGFEFGWAIPPPSYNYDPRMIQYGPRLLVVGDCQEKFQIKVWDITNLLKVTWDPFDNHTIDYPEEESEERSSRFYHDWWSRGTKQLKSTVMTLEEDLPYNISLDSILRTHLLDTAVNYIAYINLNTWLYLLHEDGNLSVMDIESGQILSTISTHGIAQDVNVVGDSEIIVTRKDRLLQSVLP